MKWLVGRLEIVRVISIVLGFGMVVIVMFCVIVLVISL